MKQTICTVCSIMGFLCLVSCNPQPEALALLRKAQLLADNNPDSAMLFIDSINLPEKSLTQKQYMQYLVARVQVRYKNYRDITGDTLVFDAARYFAQRNKNPEQTALAYFYSGCVYREQKNYGQAMRYYKRAGTYVETAKDAVWGLIQYNVGDLLAEQGLYTEALADYKVTIDFYSEQPNKQVYSLNAVGRLFLLMSLPDSAFHYFHLGLEVAEHTSDNKLKSLVTQNLGVAYKEVGRYNEAETYLRQSYVLNNNPADLPRFYLSFAELYTRTYQRDSAEIYIRKLETSMDNSNDLYFKASAFDFLANWYEARSDYKMAIYYKDECKETIVQIMNERMEQSVYEIQQKYDFEQLLNRHNRKQMAYQRWIIIFLIFIIAGGIALALFVLRRKSQVEEAKRRFDTLNRMNSELQVLLQNKNEDLRRIMLQQLGVTKKMLSLNTELMMN